MQNRRVGPYTESGTSTWSPASTTAETAIVTAESPLPVTTVRCPPSTDATASASARAFWVPVAP